MQPFDGSEHGRLSAGNLKDKGTIMMSRRAYSSRRGRIGSGSGGDVAGAALVRCACQGCGSHVHAVVLKQTISGLCSTCGGCDIARLKT